jgi:Zn-dependent protease with chaperone function
MNFYQAQDQARKQSRHLVLLFSLAVVLLVFITNICVALFVLYSNPDYALGARQAPAFSFSTFFEWCRHLAVSLGWQKSLWTTALVCGMIFIAMGFKWLSLRKGGRVVAEALGGELIQPSSRQPQERRLLNIVEEIALAAGIPVPPVYVLRNEQGINAFAAGLSQEDAVIAVTQGSMNYFNREQLQGVIAHEFSHILNGDMRLNTKLIAVLHGILMIAESGRFFMRISSSRNRYRHSHSRKDNGGLIFLFLLGLSLWLIGLLGQLFGALIKAAVSRQREFLADASAVQFTRNPEGIAQALSLIGGAESHSTIQHHAAHEIGHLFFSDVNPFSRRASWLRPGSWSLFATHPPLDVRIKRIQPTWTGKFIKPEIVPESQGRFAQPDPAYPSFAEIQSRHASPPASPEDSLTFSSAAGDTTLALEPLAAVGLAAMTGLHRSHSDDHQQQVNAVFKELTSAVHQPYDASLLILAMVLSEQDDVKGIQFGLIEAACPQQKAARIRDLERLHGKVGLLDARQKLALIELAIPSLKLMSLNQYREEQHLLGQMMKADGRVQIFEWLLFQLVKQNLDRHFALSRPLKPQYKTLASLAEYYQIVLSRVVHYGFEDQDLASVDEQDKRLAFIRAADTAGVKGMSLMSKQACDGSVFSQAVHRLSLAYPLLKPRLLKGCLAAIHFDNVISDQERYVMTAIACVMDCPVVGLDEFSNAQANTGQLSTS